MYSCFFSFDSWTPVFTNLGVTDSEAKPPASIFIGYGGVAVRCRRPPLRDHRAPRSVDQMPTILSFKCFLEVNEMSTFLFVFCSGQDLGNIKITG